MCKNSVNLSIVVPCFHNNTKNGANTLKCLSHLKANTPPHKLIVVENIERWVADKGDIYIGVSDRKTYAENANIGLLFADTDYVAVLNNDAFLPPDWFSAILECFQIPDCGIATIDSTQFNRSPKNEIIELFFGPVWVAKKEVIQKVGLFDETFRHAFDDADYWVRAYQAGYKIYMNRKVQVQHKGGDTIYELNGDSHSDIFIENRIRFNEKHKGCALPIFEKLR